MTAERIAEVYKRHWGEGNIPEHAIDVMREEDGCDACQLLVFIEKVRARAIHAGMTSDPDDAWAVVDALEKVKS